MKPKYYFSVAEFIKHEGKAAYRNNPWVDGCDGTEVQRTSPHGEAPMVGASRKSCPHWEVAIGVIAK